MPALPSNTTKVHMDSASDDPVQARAELAVFSDAINSIIATINGLFGSDGVKATALSTVGAQADLDVPSQEEAEAGVATTERVWTAQRVRQVSAVPSYSGHVIQVVNVQSGAVATTTTVIPNDDTIPQKTEGTEFMTLAITPNFSASTLLIEVTIMLSNSGTSGERVIAALFQDTTANALAAMSEGQSEVERATPVAFTHKMTAGTTSATTFKVRAGPNGDNTLTFNGESGSRLFGGVIASSITITEIGA